MGLPAIHLAMSCHTFLPQNGQNLLASHGRDASLLGLLVDDANQRVADEVVAKLACHPVRGDEPRDTHTQNLVPCECWDVHTMKL